MLSEFHEHISELWKKNSQVISKKSISQQAEHTAEQKQSYHERLREDIRYIFKNSMAF